MAGRKYNTRYILQSFSNFLCDNLDGFGQYPEKIRFHFADLAFTLEQKRRKHRKHDGFSFLTYQEIRSKFGRDFKAINEDLGFFDITSDWSKCEKRTRGVKLTDKLASMKAAFLECDPVLSELIDETGKKLRTLPKNGIDTEVNCTNRKNTLIKAVIPINYRALNRLINRLNSAGSALDIDIDYLLESARTLKHYSHTKPAGKMLIQRYSESKAGRLYAKGISLQNSPNIVVDAALSGCWEYDWENCHFAIFDQLSARIGIQCTAIHHYINNKQAVRQAIAQDVGLTAKQVKICLLALMYGAKECVWHEAAIPTIAGDKAAALYRHPFFSKFSQEINTARREIISQWPDTSQRSIINAMGKPISKKQGDRFIMAHIQQGLEARMLHIAIDQYCDQIAMLKHDGFSTFGKIDTESITSQVLHDLCLDIGLSARMHRITPTTSTTPGGRNNMIPPITDRKRPKNSENRIFHTVNSISRFQSEFFSGTTAAASF